jgi:hypothetical protein
VIIGLLSSISQYMGPGLALDALTLPSFSVMLSAPGNSEAKSKSSCPFPSFVLSLACLVTGGDCRDSLCRFEIDVGDETGIAILLLRPVLELIPTVVYRHLCHSTIYLLDAFMFVL